MFDFFQVEEIELGVPKVDTSSWRRCFFDLEGSLTTEGDIIQLAMIFTDWDLKITGVYNSYFKNTKPITPKELSVHGITEKFLEEHATYTFIESLDSIPLYSLKSTMFISYTTFDVKRIKDELAFHNLETVNFGPHVVDLVADLSDGSNCHFNAYAYGKKKGSVLIKELDPNSIDSIYEEMSQFGQFEKLTNHDALFDSVMILSLCRRHLNGNG